MDKLKEIEKMYNFDFNAEMQKMKEEMLDWVEHSNDYDVMRDILCKLLNTAETRYRLSRIFDKKFINFPYDLDCNKIELVCAIEDFITRTHYNIIDDGELFFIKAIKTDSDNNSYNQYFFTDYDIYDYQKYFINQLKNEHPYDDFQLEWIHINSIDLFVNILKELLDENNYYFDKFFGGNQEQYKVLDEDKAFGKFFEKK